MTAIVLCLNRDSVHRLLHNNVKVKYAIRERKSNLLFLLFMLWRVWNYCLYFHAHDDNIRIYIALDNVLKKWGLRMYFYKIYGKKVFSELEFPQLVSIDPLPMEEADIIVQSGTISEEIKNQENEKKYSFGEKISWLINRTTWFVVEEGRYITYELRPGGNIGYLRTYLLGYGLSMLHMQRGEMAIHCSAVSFNGEAILIAGESGSGKSTVTTRFLDEGYSLMADDVALVKMESGRAIAYPAFPYQKLCRDAAVQKGYDLNELIYIDEQKDKFMVPFSGDFSLEGKPIKMMLCLVAGEQIKEPYMKEITGIDKFHFCVNNLFLRKLLREQRYGMLTGPKCLEIASAMPMYVVGRPLQGDTEDVIWQKISVAVNGKMV